MKNIHLKLESYDKATFNKSEWESLYTTDVLQKLNVSSVQELKDKHNKSDLNLYDPDSQNTEKIFLMIPGDV